MRALRFLLSGPVAAIGCATILSGACAIDLKNDVAGKPCDKDGKCLTGYHCDSSKTCVVDSASAGGNATGGGSHVDAMGARDASGGMTDAQGGTSSGGAAATGGLAGTGGFAGTGGVAGTGGGDATPDAPINEAAPDGPTVMSDGILCAGSTCNGSDFCCVGQYPGYPNPPSDLSCTNDASNCQYLLRCDGDSDCPPQQVCCATEESNGWVAQCASSCSAVHVGCIKPSDCSNGDFCCGTWDIGSQRITETTCQSSCTNGTLGTDRLGCDSDAACGTFRTCTNSASLPGFRFCQ